MGLFGLSRKRKARRDPGITCKIRHAVEKADRLFSSLVILESGVSSPKLSGGRFMTGKTKGILMKWLVKLWNSMLQDVVRITWMALKGIQINGGWSTDGHQSGLLHIISTARCSTTI